MLRIIYVECLKQAHYAECRYAECRYAECRGANVVAASAQNLNFKHGSENTSR
jgi:hypothetical protein